MLSTTKPKAPAPVAKSPVVQPAGPVKAGPSKANLLMSNLDAARQMLSPEGKGYQMPQKAGPGTLTTAIGGEKGLAAAYKAEQTAGASAEGAFHRENALGSVDGTGKAAVEARNQVSATLDTDNAALDQEAKVGATVAGAITVTSTPVSFQLGREKLGAQAVGSLKGEAGASAEENLSLTVLKDGKVSPELNAGAKAFVGASGSASVAANLWWEKKAPAVYLDGALVLLNRYILPKLSADDASKLQKAMDAADKMGLLDDIARAVLGDAGNTDLARAEAELTGHAGAGAEAKLNLGLKNGMIKVNAALGASVGVGASVGGSIEVAPAEAGRLLLVLLSEGDAVQAQFEQLIPYLVDRIGRAAELAKAWAERKLREIDAAIEDANPEAYAAANRESAETGASVQNLLDKPSAGAVGAVFVNSVQGLTQSAISGVSLIGSVFKGGDKKKKAGKGKGGGGSGSW